MTKQVKSGVIRSELGYDDLSYQDKNLVERALSKGINRREAMSMLVAGGLSIAAAGSILTSAKDAIAATPKKGGKVNCNEDLKQLK